MFLLIVNRFFSICELKEMFHVLHVVREGTDSECDERSYGLLNAASGRSLST